MPSVCRFVLNKSNAIYMSGEVISGTIKLTTTSDKNIAAINIIFLGEGKVKWDERRGKYSSIYRGQERYIENNTLLCGEKILPAGTHTYTFNITLPPACPTSIEGKYGHVRYEIIFRINRFDNVFKQQIKVLKPVDLNLNPSYKLPLSCEDISQSCWPCASGRILCTLKIPYGAYVSGQIVKYTLVINNLSNANTNGYSYEFIRKIIFTATSPDHKQCHKQDVLVTNCFVEQCFRLTHRILNGAFTIPSTPPTNIAKSIVSVEYAFKVTVDISDCHTNCVLQIPIIIGTIPIKETLESNERK